MPVLVIDGGASHARALAAADDGHVLGAARGPAASAAPPADPGAERGLVVALSELLMTMPGAPPHAANPPTGPDARQGDVIAGPASHVDVIAGLAGTGRPSGAERARAALGQALSRAGITPRTLAVTTDAHLALWAVAPEHAGAASVLLAGTGSIALATDTQGRTAQTGGCGRLLGDEGGGFWFGARALAAATRANDGRAPEARPLARSVLATLALPDVDALIDAAPDLWAAPGRMAGLAPVVLHLAARGDAVAGSIVAEGAAALAQLAVAARARLDLPPEAPLGYGGGLLAARLQIPGAACENPEGWSAPRSDPAPDEGHPPGLWFANPLPDAVRRGLPGPLAERFAALAVPAVVGAACRWVAARSGTEGVSRLLRGVRPWRAVLA